MAFEQEMACLQGHSQMHVLRRHGHPAMTTLATCCVAQIEVLIDSIIAYERLGRHKHLCAKESKAAVAHQSGVHNLS